MTTLFFSEQTVLTEITKEINVKRKHHYYLQDKVIPVPVKKLLSCNLGPEKTIKVYIQISMKEILHTTEWNTCYLVLL